MSEMIWPHVLVVFWFIFCWLGYSCYAAWRAKSTPCLASVMHLHREDWMQRMLMRENRIADASVISNLERNAGFFASSTLIILAGVLTALGASDRTASLLAELPFAQQASQGLSETKLLFMGIIFVYAFFTFSWCMRQYNFAAILMASAPLVNEPNITDQARRAFARQTAQVLSMAANKFNFGLRAYYFGLASLAWLIGPWWLLIAATGVVFILYHREFHSSVLKVMLFNTTYPSESSSER